MSRLEDILRALAHLELGGSDAIRMATEALLGALLFNADPSSTKGKSWRKVAAVAGVVWVVFSSGTQAEQNALAWDRMFSHGLRLGASGQPKQIDAGEADKNPDTKPR